MEVGLVNLNSLVAAVLYSVIGMGIFGIGFYAFDKITPYHLWNEIVEKHNVALAIIVGACALAIAMIISAAIHG